MNFASPPIALHRPLPGWITRAVIARTRAVYEPLYERPLTDDEVIGLLLNVANLFRLLSKSTSSPANRSAAPARSAHDQDHNVAAVRRRHRTTKEIKHAI